MCGRKDGKVKVAVEERRNPKGRNTNCRKTNPLQPISIHFIQHRNRALGISSRWRDRTATSECVRITTSQVMQRLQPTEKHEVRFELSTAMNGLW